MIEPVAIDRLRRALAPHARGDAPATDDCLDADAIAATAEGALDEVTRAVVLSHLAECARCRGWVASVARVIVDPAVGREVDAVQAGAAARDIPAAAGAGRRRTHRLEWAAGAVAAAMILVLAVPVRFDDPPSHRAPGITAAAPSPVWPLGAVADAPSLRWTPISGADRYRVALFDAAGRVLYETELTGTVAVLPDSATPTPGVTYWWQVEGRVGFDRWVASELVEFSVVDGSER